VNTFLSEEQQAAKAKYEEYAREHISPAAEHLEDRTACFKEFLQSLGNSGYLGLTVPKEYGGQGMPFIYLALFAEALGHYQPSAAVAVAEQAAVIELILRFGSDTQKSRYLPLLARGEWLASTAFNEESSGSDFNAAVCTAEKKGSQFVITGKKTSVANAQHVNLFAVSARNSETQKLAIFLVESESNAASLKLSPGRKLLGMKALEINSLEFVGHTITADSMLQQDTHACDEQILYAGDIAKTVVASAAVGMTERAISLAVDHANEREQFGQKLAQFQAIQWKIADMSADSAAARLLVYKAAWCKDEEPESLRKEAATCKWYAAKTARFHTGEAVQIMGVNGLYADSVPEQFYRDAKVSELCEGTSEFQKVILAQELGI